MKRGLINLTYSTPTDDFMIHAIYNHDSQNINIVKTLESMRDSLLNNIFILNELIANSDRIKDIDVIEDHKMLGIQYDDDLIDNIMDRTIIIDIDEFSDLNNDDFGSNDEEVTQSDDNNDDEEVTQSDDNNDDDFNHIPIQLFAHADLSMFYSNDDTESDNRLNSESDKETHTDRLNRIFRLSKIRETYSNSDRDDLSDRDDDYDDYDINEFIIDDKFRRRLLDKCRSLKELYSYSDSECSD